MRYLSVCSGIEAATVAWHPLGWEAAAFSEIEKFPRAVLGHHYPDVPLHGDFTTIKGSEYGSVDLLVGGTPCQSFSIAGLRKGLDDERGNLALEYLRLAARLNARWLVWENVPGILSSNGGRDFGAFLGGLAELGYGFAYRVLDAQFFGVPQRRRRVFVVGHLGDWRRAAAVLFERHSLQGHPPPRREARERTAPTISGGAPFSRTGNERVEGDALVPELANPLTARMHKGVNTTADEGQTMIVHTLRAEGVDASEDGTGRGTPPVPVPKIYQDSEYGVGEYDSAGALRAGRIPEHQMILTSLEPTFAIQERAVCENPNAGPDGAGFRGDGVAYTLEARTQQQAIAFSCKDHGADAGDQSPTLRAMGHDGSHANAGGQVAVAFRDVAPALTSNYAKQPDNSYTGLGPNLVGQAMAVRRITPVEAERLMGFPDNYTRIPYRRKSADDCPDGPRYKALGNSFAVPVVRWIGERIQAVESIKEGVNAAVA